MNENETRVTGYRMNPAEDEILFGGELAEGMWVLPESDNTARLPGGAVTEDDRIRAQRFRQVTRLRVTHDHGVTQTMFIGEWIDGYAMVHDYYAGLAWPGSSRRTRPGRPPGNDGRPVVLRVVRGRPRSRGPVALPGHGRELPRRRAGLVLRVRGRRASRARRGRQA